MNNENDLPTGVSNEQLGADGKQREATGEILPSITKNKIPNTPAGAISEIARENSRALGGINSAKLIESITSDYAQKNDALSNEIYLKNIELDEKNKELNEMGRNLATTRTLLESYRRLEWITKIVNMVTPILIGVSVSTPEDGLTGKDIALLIVGVILLLCSTFSPLLFFRREDRKQ